MTQSNDFTSGNLLSKLLKFMLPVLGALILQAMYGAVDLLVVGRFGSSAGISAVSTGSSLINLVTFVITSLTTGVTVLISRYIGEGNTKYLGKTIGGAIAFFTVLAAILTAIVIFGADTFSALLNAPEAAHSLTVQYLRICGAGMIFVVAYNVISGIFRGLGNSRLPLLFVLIACIVNIIGDLIFVAVFNMDVSGAAIATVLAQAVSVILSLFIIRRQKNLPFTMTKKDIGFNTHVKIFVKIGFPLALQELLCNTSFLVLCSVINNLGLDASSGYGVAQKIVAFVMLVPSSLMQSVSTVVAQNVGAGKQTRAKHATYYGMAIGFIIGVFVAIFITLKGELPSAIFTSDTAYIAKSAEYLKGFAPEAFLTSILFSYMGYFNGNGKTVFTMAQSIAQTFMVRIPVSVFMSSIPGVTLNKIGYAAPSATVFGIILCTIYYVRMCKKEKKKV